MNGQEPVTFLMNAGADLTGFRQAVRALSLCETSPELITWRVHDDPELFGDRPPANIGAAGKPIILPRVVAELVRTVVRHSDPEKYALLYDLIWRMKRPKDPDPRALEKTGDPLVQRLIAMARAVQHDMHEMEAGVRFRQAADQTGDERFIAWYEPEHFVVEAAASFFVDRFTTLDWTILTPRGSLWWNRKELCVGREAGRPAALEAEAAQIEWRVFSESTFNPPRANLAAPRQHAMAKRWKDLPAPQPAPELALTPASGVEGEEEVAMAARRNPEKAADLLHEPAPKSLAELNRVIEASKPFVEGSDKAVLGEGPMHPKIAFVGEQPGDQEDVQGRPFVGPAGKLLDRTLEEAGIDREKTYITNAVKHFKYVQRGKRRLHQTPTAAEVKRYRWWLEKELEFVRPKLVVGLGATAVRALAGRSMPIGSNRGPADFDGQAGYITVHPSFLLRVPDEAKEQEYRAFVRDLKRIREMVA